MPASITHFLIAEEAAARLAHPVCAAHADYFFLGSLGPDVFFFYKPVFRRGINLGRRLHRRGVYEFFCALLEGVKEADDPRAEAYALGYVSHYCADVSFHPFVYRFLEAEKGGKLLHQQIENDWDVHFLRAKKGLSPEGYRSPFSPRKLIGENVLYPFLKNVFSKLGLSFTKPAFKRSIRNTVRYLHFFHRSCFRSRKRWERAERIFRVKGISPFYPRPEPDGRTLHGEAFGRLAGVPDADALFERAVKDSAEGMALFLAGEKGAPLPRAAFDLHMLTGGPSDPPHP